MIALLMLSRRITIMGWRKQMIEIKENQELKFNNLLSYRGKIRQSELESIGRDMELKINEKGAKRVSYPVMATYGVDGEFIDTEAKKELYSVSMIMVIFLWITAMIFKTMNYVRGK